MATTYTVFVRRLGRHHFAHLRAVAEGIDLQDCAERYLGIEHGHQAKTAHQQTVESVRAIARRRGESAWRLIGLSVTVKSTDQDKPTLEEFMAERDLEGWSESEVSEMYAEAYPIDRKTERGLRLRIRQLDLIRSMEDLAAETPLPSDMVNGWFDDQTSNKLITAGIINLGELNRKVSTGGRWYSALPGVGSIKAQRIAAHLATLLPLEVLAEKPVFVLDRTPSLFQPLSPSPSRVLKLPIDQSGLMVLPPGQPNESFKLLAANTDEEAVEAWIKARAGSEKTATVYNREAVRLRLWLQYEAGGKTFAQMQVEDCMAYMAFLQNVPKDWVSRKRAAPGQPGWAPFRGQLSHGSHRQAITIVASLFTWLAAAGYLAGNPWVIVNKKTGDDKNRNLLDTKAFSEVAMTEILNFIDEQPPSPSRARIRFILRFVEAVGLRSAELLSACLGDFRLEPEGWVMKVDGKGAKQRVAVVPTQAMDALQEYLAERGLGGIQTADPKESLLATLKPSEDGQIQAVEKEDPADKNEKKNLHAVGYQALYEHVRGWLRRAIAASALPFNERSKLEGASTHWLRHTFGTRAIAREVPIDVVQQQMGHASIQTTTATYGRAPIKRRVDELAKAFR